MKLEILICQLKQLKMLDEHELIQLKKMFDMVSELDNKVLEKKLKKEIYCHLIKYVASFIEFMLLSAMIIQLINGSAESIPLNLIRILIIETIQEKIQYVLRKENDRYFEYIAKAIIMGTPKKLFSANLPGIARDAAVNSYHFLESNVSFFYRKAVVSDSTPPENNGRNESLLRMVVIE